MPDSNPTAVIAECIEKSKATDDPELGIIVFGETFVPSLSNAELCGKTAFGPRLSGPLRWVRTKS
jgi:hypothetical protein